MCTVSWVHVGLGYHLMCNRDERRTRKPAAPPEVRESRGVCFVAPTDGDFGGTWIGVNELGLSLCLLNGYDDVSTTTSDGYTSRGLLVLELMDSRSRLDVRERLGDFVLGCYRPFTLVALSPSEPVLVARWTGRDCAVEVDGDHSLPLVSSSVDTEHVTAWRRIVLHDRIASEGTPTPEMLEAYHRSHEPEPSASSVCMHRDDAETMSYSHVSVVRDSAAFAYTIGAPCRSPSLEPVVLQLVTRGVER